MKFAFETLLWGRRIENLDGVLDMIAAFGYQGIELAQAPDDVRLKMPDGSSRRITDLGPVAFHEKLLEHGRANGNPEGIALVGMAGGSLRERIDFCLPCPALRPFLYVEHLDFPTEDILDAITADPPFVIALHPHWFKKIQRIEHARRVMQRKIEELKKEFDQGLWPDHERRIREREIAWENSFKLLPDTAHLTIAGDLMPKALPPVHEIAAVHFKDWKSTHGRHSHRYAQGFVPLGEGEVPLTEVLQSLRSTFQGWIIVGQNRVTNTKVEVLIACTRWLIQNAPFFGSLRTSERYRKQLPQDRPAKASIQDPTSRELEFLREVLPTTTHRPHDFYQKVTDTFYDMGGFITVQIFGWHPGRDDGFQQDELLRLGASGFPGSCPILPTEGCLCGEVVKDGRMHMFDLMLPEHSRRFRDKKLLKELHEVHEAHVDTQKKEMLMVSIPIFNISNPQHLRYVLNLFPEPSRIFDRESMNEMERIGKHISSLADHMSEKICSAAFLHTCYISRNVSGRQGYINALRDMIKTELDCRGVTILLEDETRQRLQIASTTGVEWREDIPENKRYYTRGDGQTGTVWATGEIAMISNNYDHHAGENWGAKSREVGDDARCRECIYAPIGRPWSSPIGVIRVVDKKVPKGRNQATTMFTDDDAAVLDSIIQAALSQIEVLVLQERQLKALTRMTHEFKSPLMAINGSVDLIRQELRSRQLIEGEFFQQEYLEDILDWSRIMANQAQNARIFATSSQDLPISPSRILLRADIIMPAVRHLRRLIMNEGIHEREIEIGDFSTIPAIYLDKGQFLQVALNMVSDAIKYRDPARKFRLRIDGWQHGLAYVLEFSDHGMGVPFGLEEAVFEPGYRAREAQLRDVTGQGVGLAVVETILKSHGGQIRLTKHYNPTTFQIILPDYLKHSDWVKTNKQK